jgi:hypothetical protein
MLPIKIYKKMKKIAIFALLILAIFGCKNMKQDKESNNKEEQNKPLIVGNDTDKHGCKASAGYTWSVLKKDCIRLWETGIQLSPIENKSYVATLILGENEAELFIFNEKESIILTKMINKNDIYTGKDYALTKSANEWLLTKNGQLIYKK